MRWEAGCWGEKKQQQKKLPAEIGEEGFLLNSVFVCFSADSAEPTHKPMRERGGIPIWTAKKHGRSVCLALFTNKLNVTKSSER